MDIKNDEMIYPIHQTKNIDVEIFEHIPNIILLY